MKPIKLMADYECHPLWDMTPRKYRDINPEDLPISQNLKQQLAQWARSYDKTLNMADPASPSFQSPQAANDFKKEGCGLVERLQDELGIQYMVIYKA